LKYLIPKENKKIKTQKKQGNNREEKDRLVAGTRSNGELLALREP
jgi:hypothetical protein